MIDFTAVEELFQRRDACCPWFWVAQRFSAAIVGLYGRGVFGVHPRSFSIAGALDRTARILAEISQVALLADSLQQLIRGGGGQRLPTVKNPDTMLLLEWSGATVHIGMMSWADPSVNPIWGAKGDVRRRARGRGARATRASGGVVCKGY
jgi:hypothetical protein